LVGVIIAVGRACLCQHETQIGRVAKLRAKRLGSHRELKESCENKLNA
jgi:hypothetical protein